MSKDETHPTQQSTIAFYTSILYIVLTWYKTTFQSRLFPCGKVNIKGVYELLEREENTLLGTFHITSFRHLYLCVIDVKLSPPVMTEAVGSCAGEHPLLGLDLLNPPHTPLWILTYRKNGSLVIHILANLKSAEG